jgi:signal peptidase I
MRGDDPLALQRAAAAHRERSASKAPATLPDAVEKTSIATTDPRDEAVPPQDVPISLDIEASGHRRKRRKRSKLHNTVEWIIVLAAALVVALVVKTWLFQAFYIPSGSMEPTLAIGDRVLVNKISYDLDDVDRGDIIVFERPDTWGTGEIDDLIKRVIALPGETVESRDGVVLVNGEALDEPYLPDGVTTPPFYEQSGCVPSCVVPDDQVFVLGDNRGNSDASNHFGPLPFDTVVGRAFVRVWPFSNFGGI